MVRSTVVVALLLLMVIPSASCGILGVIGEVLSTIAKALGKVVADAERAAAKEYCKKAARSPK